MNYNSLKCNIVISEVEWINTRMELKCGILLDDGWEREKTNLRQEKL